jgi:hypothetical protein
VFFLCVDILHIPSRSWPFFLQPSGYPTSQPNKPQTCIALKWHYINRSAIKQRAGVPVTLYTRVRVELGSNLGRDDVYTDRFIVINLILQEISEIVPLVGHDRFLHKSFPNSSYHRGYIV